MDEIIKFKGRNYSGYKNLNFLHSDNNIFFMDNHRASLWCYLQTIKNKKINEINYYHIDEHTDTLYANHPEIMNSIPASFLSLDIESYLDCTWKSGRESYPTFTWDTYGAVFLDHFKDNISLCCFATHKEGDSPRHPNLQEVESRDLIYDLMSKTEKNKNWWVNVDLDYFFIKDKNGEFIQYFSDEYIVEIFECIKIGINKKNIDCLTVCLSPECCGGWENSEKLAQIAANVLDINFEIK